MSKKDKIETIEVDDVNLVPELLDGNHRVIPIVTGGDEVVEEVEVPEIIPILTLRSSVLFPGAITPITVGRDKSISLVRAVNAENGILGAVLGLILIVVIVLLAVFGPGMNSYTYSGQDLSQKNFAPRVPGIERLGILDGSEKMSTTTGKIGRASCRERVSSPV